MIELLSEPIRKFIYSQRWESFRPIQAEAIRQITSSDKHFILASRTASGKTEAAFLPVLSKVDFRTAGVKVLYISPLIALINDQFVRLIRMCEHLDITVTKWHGEASKSDKDKLLRHPAGVMLITPESIEAMLVNHPQNIQKLFNTLDYVIIDEIHSFLGTDRGVQLQSLLSRLKQTAKSDFRVVGLSATIGDFDAVMQITGDPANTILLRDQQNKEIEATFKYYEGSNVELPLDLLKDLYRNTYQNKVLVFPNSRGRAEEIAVKLLKIAQRVNGHSYYFSHHSSVHKELREYVEHFAKDNKHFPFTIACTSTLELGIDIGSVDKVVQVDATSTVASLVQRVGRSGRRDGMLSVLLFYATDPWSLFQSMACFSLYRDGFVEPVHNDTQAYDIFFHQLLSTVKQTSGITYPSLKARMLSNAAFSGIAPEVMDEITRFLLQTNILELIGDELIIGVEGEYVVNSRDFYSVFENDINYKIICKDKPIGEMPLSSALMVDENIFLAARIWKVIDIDDRALKVFVIPALDGKKPRFSGSGAGIHPKIRERMLEILVSSRPHIELEQSATDILEQYRKVFSFYALEDLAYDRPLLVKDRSCVLFTFQGTKINKSLKFVLEQLSIDFDADEHESCFTFNANFEELKSFINRALAGINEIDNWLAQIMSEQPTAMAPGKWGKYLPSGLQLKLLKRNYYDFEGLAGFLANLNMVIAG